LQPLAELKPRVGVGAAPSVEGSDRVVERAAQSVAELATPLPGARVSLAPRDALGDSGSGGSRLARRALDRRWRPSLVSPHITRPCRLERSRTPILSQSSPTSRETSSRASGKTSPSTELTGRRPRLRFAARSGGSFASTSTSHRLRRLGEEVSRTSTILPSSCSTRPRLSTDTGRTFEGRLFEQGVPIGLLDEDICEASKRAGTDNLF
jgi:hypothetical protein